MEKESFTIPNISCGHCVMTIENELNELAGVQSVEGNPDSKTVTVSWKTPATVDGIRNKLKEINYPAQ